MTVAALFVQPAPGGIYPELLGSNRCWDEARDARTYLDSVEGGLPVVAHPPCNLWVNMAAVNWKRYGRQRPAWYSGGDDGGCFEAALAAVRQNGGVLEHPAGSHAWMHYRLQKPYAPDASQLSSMPSRYVGGWVFEGFPFDHWTCEVWQSAYGHKARKRTWLLYCGKRPPFELRWERQPGTHQVGWFDRNKPTLSKRAASATPRAFAEELIRLAEWSRGAPTP